MSLRSRFLAVFSLLLAVGVGSTGAVLILQHARHDQALLAEKQLLLVEHAAFALQGNLTVAARELARIARLPEVDPEDSDTDPERQLLYGAHENSVLIRTIREIDSAGRVKIVHPPRDSTPGAVEDVSDRRWFGIARHTHQPFFYTAPERASVPETIGVVVPLHRDGAFSGAIQGELDLVGDTSITSELSHAAGSEGEVVLVDKDGRVLYPRGGKDLSGPGWAMAQGELSRSRAGSHRVSGGGGEFLYAWAPVNVGSWGVIIRWPWASLSLAMREQVLSTVAILVVGVVVAAIMAVLLAAWLSRPLGELGEMAERIARGEPGGERPAPVRTTGRRDEVGELMRVFAHMESQLVQRDARIRDDIDTISRLNASLEERVAERTRALEAAQARLLEVERFAAMGKTAAAIAHEVRNALNGLGMCVDLVLADQPPPREGQLGPSASMRVRAQIHHEIARLRDITESLLTFARTPRLEPAVVDLHQVVARALDVCAEQIEDGVVTIERDLAGQGAPLPVRCDGFKVQGVVINVVKNAVESMTTRPLNLLASAPVEVPRRTLSLRTHLLPSGAVELSVRDTGPGLSPEARAHLFEPFYTTKVTGTGLGLATSRRIIEAHGGSITVRDAREVDDGPEGTLVVITLPPPPEVLAQTG